MKILIINTIEFNRNGMSAMIMNYYNNFNHDEIKVDFLINKRIDTEFRSIIQKQHDSIFVFKNRNRHVLSYVKYLKKIAEKNSYDIIYIHGNSATMAVEEFALRKTTSKVVVHAHGETTDHPLLHKILYPYFKNHYTIAFAASKSAGNFLFHDKPFRVIQNGINGKEFNFNEEKRKIFRKKFNIEDSKVILQVGAFTEQKNHTFSIQLLEQLVKYDSSIKLILAGNGPLQSVVQKNASDLEMDDNILFLGEVSNLTELYSAADYLIFPSAWEPFGIVALEGQMAGLPVFVSDVFSKNVAVTSNITFLPLSVSKWVDAINVSELRGQLPTKDLIASLKKSGYDIEDNAKQLVSFFNKLIRNEYEE